ARRTALHRAAFGVPLGDRVALADLRAVEVDAVVETGRGFERDATGRGGADVHHVDHAARPGEQLARVLGVEDRDEGLDVGRVDVADRRLVVGEDVPRPDPRVVLPAVAD